MNAEHKPADSNSVPLPMTPGEYAAGEAAPRSGQVPPGPTSGGPEIGVAQLREIVAVLQSELDNKTAEAAGKQDQYLRTMAEMENVRRRMEKEKEETAKYAISKFAKDVLSVGDNFQRVVGAVPKGAVENDPALKNLLDGVVLAEREFRAVLDRNGVRQIDPTGQPFNPHQHQAVMEKEDLSVANGTVLQVFQSGYLIDDRCLRPAMVVVSRGGPKAAKGPDGTQS